MHYSVILVLTNLKIIVNTLTHFHITIYSVSPSQSLFSSLLGCGNKYCSKYGKHIHNPLVSFFSPTQLFLHCAQVCTTFIIGSKCVKMRFNIQQKHHCHTRNTIILSWGHAPGTQFRACT